jgi:hypothetical protein
MVERYGAQIEVADVFEEDTEFGIPATLKRLMRESGVDPNERRIHITRPAITEDLYGAVPLTVGSSG